MLEGIVPPLSGGQPSPDSPDTPTPAARRRVGVGLRFSALIVVLIGVIVAGIAVGSVSIPLSEVWRALVGGHVPYGDAAIIHEVRLPRTLTATLCGAALGVAGCQMQTLFRNPLADPFVLGVSSGASIGVAVITLVSGASATVAFASGLGTIGNLGSVVAACLGALAIMCLVLALTRVVANSNTILLLGVILSYMVSAGVTVLLAGASPQQVQQYVEWGFGSFEGVTWPQLDVLVPVLVLCLLAALATIKSLNALLLGERYAATMGVDIRRARLAVIATASILGGTVTAFAGPIAFLGIAIPHIARSILGTSDHRQVLPACVLIGASLALAADIAAQLPGSGVLPLNAVNAIIGAPVVIIVLLRTSRRAGDA